MGGVEVCDTAGRDAQTPENYMCVETDEMRE